MSGVMRSFENCSAAASFGCTMSMGAGSRWTKKPTAFSINAVFINWVQTIAVMVSTPSSVTASIGPRAISTVRVDQSPEVEPASGASLRNRSAHSGTLIRGGGVSPRLQDRSSLSSLLCVCEVGFRLAEAGEVLLDMVVQRLQQRLDGNP